MGEHEINKYKQLQTKVLERDNCTCRICGYHTNAPPHHILYKSHCGIDDERNMITLCTRCHRKVHTNERHYRDILFESQYEIYGYFDIKSVKKKDRYKNFKYSK